MAGAAIPAGAETNGHVMFPVKKQKEIEACVHSCSLSFLFNPRAQTTEGPQPMEGPQPTERGYPHLGWVFQLPLRNVDNPSLM